MTDLLVPVYHSKILGLKFLLLPRIEMFTFTVTLNSFMTVQFIEASRYVQCTENAMEGLPMNIKTAV